MEKSDIAAQIIATLQRDLETARQAARASVAAATDPGSKAENKYDTRTLEASYLARGQAFRVEELTEALADWTAYVPSRYPAGQPVKSGALVKVRETGGEAWYLLGPSCGGMEVTTSQGTATIITPQSPLGQKLSGKRAGARIELRPGKPALTLEILDVS